MNSNQILFKFKDGEKPIQVGSKVYLSYCNYRKGEPQEYVVQKIGKKYVTFGNGNSVSGFKFNFDGKAHSDYSHHYEMYSSMEAYETEVRNGKCRTALYRCLHSLGHSYKHLNEEQIKKAVETLGMTEQYEKELSELTRLKL